jgi:hypothetical protein
MRTSLKIGGVLAVLGTILASTTGTALANTNDVSGIVSAGNLSATTSDITLTGVTLDGQTVQHATGSPEEPWTITDARGSSAAWSLSVSGTAFISAAGLVEDTERTIAITNLTITPGLITAGSGSDPATTGSVITLSDVPQSLVSVSSAGMGSYSFTPEFDLAVPANAFRSNYSDAVGSSDLNPYIATVTYTAA